MKLWHHYCNYFREQRMTSADKCAFCGAIPTEPTATAAEKTAVPVKSRLDHAVDRFLCWPLPRDFCPDGGISYDLRTQRDRPTGTNLFTAAQARAMFEHCFGVEPELPSTAGLEITGDLLQAHRDAIQLSNNPPVYPDGKRIDPEAMRQADTPYDYTMSRRVTAEDLGLTREEADRVGGQAAIPTGETLRDRFAMRAMEGMVASGLTDTWGNIAHGAYSAADAMLETRKQ